MEIGGLKKGLEVWCPFGEDAEVLIRHITRDELQELGRKATVVRYVNHQKAEELDRAKADELLGKAVVKDWKGFTMDGAELPCTPENVSFLMTKWSAFATFVNNMCVDLEALMQAEKEQTIKNSSLTSGQE